MTDTMVRHYGDTTFGDAFYGVAAIDAVPFFVVEVEAPAGTWVDVTCDVRSIDIHRGRSKMLDAWAASTMTVAFADFSDAYNAWNASGVWAANGAFRTGVPIRVSVERNGIRRRLFTGTTDNVADSWPNAGADALTTVNATDAFKGLARQRIAGAAAQELSGARVGRILTAAGFSGARLIDVGLSTMAAVTMDGVAVDVMDEARESEWGWVYVNSDGAAVFRQRDARATDPRMVNVQWSFSDNDDPIPIAGGGPNILQEPFDALTAWATVSGAPAIVAARTGNGVSMAGSAVIAYTIPAASESATVIVGFAMRPGTPLAATDWVRLMSDGGTTDHIRVRCATDGAVTVLRGGVGIGAAALPAGTVIANAWHYYEIKLVLHDTAGVFELRRDGALIGGASGIDTKAAGTKTTFDTVRLAGVAGVNATLFDDLWMDSASYWGDQTIPMVLTTTGVCYSDLTLMASDDDVVNTADVTRPGGVLQHAQDDPSRTWYGPRTYTRTNLPLALDNDALALAQAIVADHAQNERRVDAITFYALDEASADAAYGVRMLDRVRVIRHTNAVVDAELLVQGIRHSIAPMGADRRATWAVTLQTTNARVVRDAGLWDISAWDVDKWSV